MTKLMDDRLRKSTKIDYFVVETEDTFNAEIWEAQSIP
jgi:hypothetical protein